MSLLSLDIEEGVISERDAERCEGDSTLYLENFEDPFRKYEAPMVHDF
jgi:hypothetical protein